MILVLQQGIASKRCLAAFFRKQVLFYDHFLCIDMFAMLYGDKIRTGI